MRLLDAPLNSKEKEQIIEMLKGNISRICVSDSSRRNYLSIRFCNR